MRAIWTGSIAFGLVNIPVELHRAIHETRPRFRLLHAKDKSPVRFDRVCEREDRAVAWKDVVKGYEYAKGQFVVLAAEDFARAALEKTHTFDIAEFVRRDEIDDRFFETPYYAVPAKGGDRAYAVLREALRESGRIGVGKIMLRETQHLAALGPIGDALVLTMIRFSDELADSSGLRFPSAGARRPREIQMAKTLVDQLSAKWSPSKYTDEYQANLQRVIRAKVKGTTPRLEDERHEPRGEIVDLMERLRQSLGGARSERAGTAGRVAGRAAREPGARRGRGARAATRASSRRPARRHQRAAAS